MAIRDGGVASPSGLAPLPRPVTVARMARFPSHLRGRFALAAGAVQTLAAAVAGAVWLDSGGIAAGAVLFGSWAALALALMISSGAADEIVTLSTPPEQPTGDHAPPEPAVDINTLKLGALLPLCQTTAGSPIVAAASLGGFTPTEYVLVGTGIGGAVGTWAAITGAAYLAVLLGVLLVLITVVPALMIRRAARQRTPKRSRVPAVALAVIVLALFPMATAAVLATDTPSGSPRSAAYAALLSVLGFDFSDQGSIIKHQGWLWTARICGAVIAAAVAAALMAQRSARLAAEAAAARTRPIRPRSKRSASKRPGRPARPDRSRRPRYRRRPRT
jgi:hypothetical protein